MYKDKWYGDEWLEQRDAFNSLSEQEMIVLCIQQQIPLPLPENEVAILSGAKKMLTYNARFLRLINLAVVKNPALYDKYMRDGRIIDLKKIQEDQKKQMIEMMKNARKKPSQTMFQ